ncbi:LPS assembly lipoprotein LptE [Vibrio cholerae]|uniref:LPS-assembly lipoprotein LptE n=1 Tax=Vibrio cholerae TaxID=666 RepID=UPI00155E6115|nr:LPS assembly lipoprotein LptE [Vibrio cholerae]EGR0723540.1 luciferase [Vibrio cholerae]EJL6895463.1 luciferase [Vibrio cholerae]EKF6142634.1 luciferase [Vibrio cholerae]EKF9617351.1 luciferase [Vibrio cholerae]EKO5177476.1 luciferase [Vibrio cholerae]
MRNTLFPTLKWSLLVLMTSLLTACGFHLRGDYDIPQELSRMSLTSYDQYSTFTRMVHRQLRLNKIDLQAPAEDLPNLHLLSESTGERTLSLYQNPPLAAEIELTLVATYRITVPHLGNRTFTTSVTRSYLSNPLTALAKSVERDMIEDEMRKLAASQIVRQMARLKADFARKTLDDESIEGEGITDYRVDTQEVANPVSTEGSSE